MGKDKYAPARLLGFRSMFEANLASKMDKSRLKYVYEPYSISYEYEAKYIPDFKLPNGILIEAKGRFTAKDRSKMKLVKTQNPKLDIRFVFQRASNKLTKAKKSMTYGQWADKNGFKWSEGSIPKEWWKE